MTSHPGPCEGVLPTEAELRSALSRSGALEGMVRAIMVLPSVGSTNDLAMEDGREGLLVVAGEQTGGRGRHGSSWVSPPGGLYLSYSPPSRNLPARWTDLSPLAALAAAESMDRALMAAGSDARASIKWPNDLLVEGRKAGGVLVQTRGADGLDRGMPPRAVIGMGLNVNTGVDAGSFDIGPRSGMPPLEPVYLAQFADRPLNLGVLLMDLVTNLLDHIAKGLDEIALSAYRARCETLGLQVSFIEAGRRLTGMALDVLPAGAALLVELESGEHRVITGGEVMHLRRAYTGN